MEQFTLEKYLADPTRKVVTRSGLKARIICVDRKSTDRPIVSLVYKNGAEEPLVHNSNGRYSFYDGLDNPFDLFFAPNKQSRWVFLFKVTYDDGPVISSSSAFLNKTDAEAAMLEVKGFALTEITWEE